MLTTDFMRCYIVVAALAPGRERSDERVGFLLLVASSDSSTLAAELDAINGRLEVLTLLRDESRHNKESTRERALSLQIIELESRQERLLTGKTNIEALRPYAHAQPETPAQLEATRNYTRFKERLVDGVRSDGAVIWQRLPNGVRAYPRAYAYAWTSHDARDAVYRELFFGLDKRFRCAPALWRLVFCDRSRKHAALAVGPDSGLAWPMSSNGIDWQTHRIGMRVHGGTEDQIFYPLLIEASREISRNIEVQLDGNLCAMHALNNVAGGVVLTPVTFAQSIFDVADPQPNDLTQRAAYSWFRERLNTGGTEGELMVAALRRGIVLGRVVLRDIFDVTSFAQARADTRMIERIARRNGGAVLLSPGGGHYVAIVPVNSDRWAIVNDDGLELREQEFLVDASFGALLETYYVRRRANARDTSFDETRRRLRGATRTYGGELRMIVPLHYRKRENVRDEEGELLEHLWARHVVNNTTIAIDNVVPPVDDLLLAYNGALRDAPRLPSARYLLHPVDGFNPFTAVVAKTYVELELNDVADEIAAQLVLGRRAPLNRAEIGNLIARIRSTLRSPRAIGLLLGDRSATSCGVIDERQWLRLFVLHVVTRDNMIAQADWRVLFLLMNCTFTDHRQFGDTEGRYPAIVDLWRAVSSAVEGASAQVVAEFLPRPETDLPSDESIRLLFFTLPVRDTVRFEQFVLAAITFDRSLWLLSTAYGATPSRAVTTRRLIPYFYQRNRRERTNEDFTREDVPLIELLRREVFTPQGSTRTPRTVKLDALPDVGDGAVVSLQLQASFDAIVGELTQHVDDVRGQLRGNYFDAVHAQVKHDAAEYADALTSRYLQSGFDGFLMPSIERFIPFDEAARRQQ